MAVVGMGRGVDCWWSVVMAEDFTFTFLPRKQKRNNSAERNKNELWREIKMSWVLTL